MAVSDMYVLAKNEYSSIVSHISKGSAMNHFLLPIVTVKPLLMTCNFKGYIKLHLTYDDYSLQSKSSGHRNSILYKFHSNIELKPLNFKSEWDEHTLKMWYELFY